MTKQCNIEGCDKKHVAKGYCIAHYRKFTRYGDPLGGRRPNERHGMHGTLLYDRWVHIKQRCENPASNNYLRYGGRGISICKRWSDSFLNFYADMGEPPTQKHSIERRDVNGDYEPSNCYWADRSTQCANQRLRLDNSSGYSGVTKNHKNWQVSVRWKGVIHYLGTFDTPEEASAWRDAYIIANNWPHRLNCGSL